MIFENLPVDGQALTRLARERVCKMGFSGNSGIALSDHAKNESMVKRQVTLEDLALCILRGQFFGFESPSNNESVIIRVVGESSDGDLLALIIAVGVSNKTGKLVFKLVTVFQHHNSKKGAEFSASFFFLPKQNFHAIFSRMKIKVLIFVVLVFSLAAVGFGQTKIVKFKRAETSRAYSRSVGKVSQNYRIFIRRGSQLFLALDGSVKYRILSAGREYRILPGGLVGLKNSTVPLGTETNYLVKINSVSARRESYRVNFSATVLN